MNKILVIGAGRSATSLIDYLLNVGRQRNWSVTVADADLEMAKQKVNNHPVGRPIRLEVTKTRDRRSLIRNADVVVSLVPSRFHIEVAKDCLNLRKHLITASYASPEMYRMEDEVKSKSLIFMSEIGLDPGIDHMSAKKCIDRIQMEDGQIISFRSYTGGLIAPESDDNPWHYKFTWNPYQVVSAGRGTAQYLANGKCKYIPYTRLFKHFRKVNIQGVGEYEVYPNRDSLYYRHVYGLDKIPNIFRGTIRYKGFCEAWDALVTIGLTDDSFPVLESEFMTYRELLESFTGEKPGDLKEKVSQITRLDVSSEAFKKLEWLGLFSAERIKLKLASPARILEDILRKKWALKSNDKDMVIMQHEYEFKLENKLFSRTSTLVMKGDDERHTAMSKLVGLPIGILTKLVMEGRIKTTGVQIPVMREVYEPVMKELDDSGVRFSENTELIDK